MSVVRTAGLGLTLALVVSAHAAPAQSSPDEAAIRALEARQAQAWNAHDIRAYAGLFTVDADVVNVLGWWWKSRAELEAKLGRAFATVFRSSLLTIGDLQVKFPAPDVAVVQVRWTMTGALSPDGNPSHTPEQGVQTQVLQRRAGTWLICAFQNTNSVPERPFPVAGVTPGVPDRGLD